jgi:hypothetical protein
MSLKDNLLQAQADVVIAQQALDAANAKVSAAQAELDKSLPVVALLEQAIQNAETLAEQGIKDTLASFVNQAKALF